MKQPLFIIGAPLYRAGVAIFAFSIFAIGVETIVCAGTSTDLGYGYRTVSIIPWLPPIPWLAVIFGAILSACGAGLLFKRTVRPAALGVGLALLIPNLILDVPKYVAHALDMSLRTQVLEPITIVCLAWMLLPGKAALSPVLIQIARYALALSLIVFGVDHFLALASIGTLLPAWIPWHVFWVAFFGAGFIAAGVAIAIGRLQRWAACGIALMFAIWVVTLHGPRVLGLYGIAGAPQSPAEWESLFIAIAFCGGYLALAFREVQPGIPDHVPFNFI